MSYYLIIYYKYYDFMPRHYPGIQILRVACLEVVFINSRRGSSVVHADDVVARLAHELQRHLSANSG